MNENTKETYAAQTQRAGFVASLAVEVRSVVDLGDSRLLMPNLGDPGAPCTGRAKICTESPGTPKRTEWLQGTAAARRQPSSPLFH